MFSLIDHVHMSRALKLAEKGLFSTSPNPRVGCVIAHADQVIGSGWHHSAGQAHAEINALNSAGKKAFGATVYLTLEPCGHHGLTPPCVKELIEANVAKVVVAMEDPNPLVMGHGIALLKEAKIEVQVGLMETEARTLNVGFVSRMTRNRPWVRMKIAASLDGKTALNNGTSQWITGEAARRDAHRFRARSCAILTGVGTVLADDPQLTVRHVKTIRQPLRAVVDSHLETPLNAKLLRDGGLIFTASTDEKKTKDLCETGAQLFVLPNEKGGVALFKMMQALADFQVNEVLVEAGCRLNGALIKANLVDELVIYFSPHLIGDVARGMLSLPELTHLSEKRALKIQDLRMIGQDIRIIAQLS